jgi:hypothetical protein
MNQKDAELLYHWLVATFGDPLECRPARRSRTAMITSIATTIAPAIHAVFGISSASKISAPGARNRISIRTRAVS